MLDIQFIRENKEKVQEAARAKQLDFDVEELLSVDKERLQYLKEVEEMNSLKNDINDLIARAENEEERVEIILKGKEIKATLEEREPLYSAAKGKFDALMATVPNILSPDTPLGTSDKDNVETFRSDNLPQFSFAPRTHIELGKILDILDLERGAKVAGYRGYYLKNEGVTLVMALMFYAMKKLTEKGYTPIIPPTLVKGSSLFGSGYFKGEDFDPAVDEVYQVANHEIEADGTTSKEAKFLVGTAEPSLLAYHSDEVLEGSRLPIRFSGFSQCYRSEIGSYGKDTKGIYRVHEFMKVEQIVMLPADEALANQVQDEMIALSEEMHRELGIPYRKLAISSGDLSAGKYRQFDLEAWLPGLDRYGETGSASSFLDWQSRRLNIKYKDSETGEKKYVYMLNNTALPSPRILIAILENFQQEDGSVIIPEVLRPYVGKDRIEPRS